MSSSNAQEVEAAISCLQALQDPTRYDHNAALEALQGYVTNPAFNATILHLLAHGGSYPPEAGITVPIRQLAGYVLKNYTFQDKATISNPQLLPTVKADLLVSLGDSTDDIRNTAAALLCHLATQLELPLWADILQGLLSNIANGIASPTVSMFGAVSALSLICEDCSVTISENLSVLEAVTATLQPAALCSNDAIRAKVVEAMNTLLYSMHFQSNSLSPAYISVGHYLTNLLTLLTNDKNPVVLKHVCEGLGIFLGHQLDAFGNSWLNAAMEGTLAIIDNCEDETTAIEACDFWGAIVWKYNDVSDLLRPYIPRILQLLITKMTLTQTQLMLQRQNYEEMNSGERAVTFNSEHDRETGLWTLRKQAATTFDQLSECFGTEDIEILPHVLPTIQGMLQMLETNPLQAEAGLLALGALSTGRAGQDMEMFLPQLVPYLLACQTHTIQEVRTIACWVFSRYASWICTSSSSTESQQPLVDILGGTLRALVDDDPAVQHAACNVVICILPELSYTQKTALGSSFLPPLLATLQTAGAKYGIRNSLSLCDVICEIVRTFPEVARSTQYTALYLPFLISKLEHANATEDIEINPLVPVLECFVYILPELKTECQPIAMPLFLKAIELGELGLKLRLAEFLTKTDDDIGRDDDLVESDNLCLLRLCLGIFGAFAEGLRENFSVLISSSGQAQLLVHLIDQCLDDPDESIQSEVLALFASFSKGTFSSLVLPRMEKLVPKIFSVIDNLDRPMASNGIWAFVEIVVGSRQPELFAQCILGFRHTLYTINSASETEEDSDDLRSWLRSAQYPMMTRCNAALAAARLAMFYQKEFLEVFGECIDGICVGLTLAPESEEKQQAIEGLLSLVALNPSVVTASKKTLQLFLLSIFSHAICGFENLISEFDEYYDEYGGDQSNGNRAKFSLSKYLVNIKQLGQSQHALYSSISSVLLQLRVALTVPVFDEMLNNIAELAGNEELVSLFRSVYSLI